MSVVSIRASVHLHDSLRGRCSKGNGKGMGRELGHKTIYPPPERIIWCYSKWQPAKQMYPGQTDFSVNQYEEAVKRTFGYLLIDLKTTTQDSCRLRTNVLPSEEGFNQAGFQENIPQELLKYLKQQTLSPVPLLPAMQEIQGNMDDVRSRNDLRDDEEAKRYFQLQNRYLSFKEQ